MREPVIGVALGSGVGTPEVALGSGVGTSEVALGSGVGTSEVALGSGVGTSEVALGSGVGTSEVAIGVSLGIGDGPGVLVGPGVSRCGSFCWRSAAGAGVGIIQRYAEAYSGKTIISALTKINMSSSGVQRAEPRRERDLLRGAGSMRILPATPIIQRVLALNQADQR